MEINGIDLEEKLLLTLYQLSIENNSTDFFYSAGEILEIEPFACRNVVDKAVEHGYVEVLGAMTQVPRVKITNQGIERVKQIAEAEKL